MFAPWNAMWSEDDRYEVRPCRHAGGQLAIWQPQTCKGRPIFARPNMVRQRKSIAELVCTVCGLPTDVNDRWYMNEPSFEGWYSTTEAPVHFACARLALEHCPHLRQHNCGAQLTPMPGGARMLEVVVNDTIEADLNVKLNGRRVIGHLKLAWPPGQFTVNFSKSPD